MVLTHFFISPPCDHHTQRIIVLIVKTSRMHVISIRHPFVQFDQSQIVQFFPFLVVRVYGYVDNVVVLRLGIRRFVIFQLDDAHPGLDRRILICVYDAVSCCEHVLSGYQGTTATPFYFSDGFRIVAQGYLRKICFRAGNFKCT